MPLGQPESEFAGSQLAARQFDGRHFDGYVVEELVARTATTSILRAKESDTGREVAIKMPHPEVEGDPLFYQRFLREQEICKSLDHPAVVKAYPGGARRRRYMVMEFAQGNLLRRMLSDRVKFSAGQAVKIAVAICDALDYVHSQGVVHRDLKPENIMVDAEDRIKLLDFGIASRTGARRLTFGKLSQVMGTPDYIAPEQIKGKRGDARTDVYALGIILYEMLTGQTPFHGSNPFLVMNNRLVNDPVPPREIDPGISPELQTVVLHALQRLPGDRYATAREFADDLLHLDQVRIADPVRNCEHERSPLPRTALRYATAAMIFLFIFGVLLFAAHHG